MKQENVQVRELAGWGFDESEYRPCSQLQKSVRSCELIAQRAPYRSSPALVSDASAFPDFFNTHLSRADLAEEMTGLDWMLGMIDIRLLLAFQRRLVFDPDRSMDHLAAQNDLAALFNLSFAESRPITYSAIRGVSNASYLFQTDDPNICLQRSNNSVFPFTFHAGSPFFEVAQFKDRWFLRDGYHRAFALLRANIFIVPAVVVQAKTLEELGATQPWFFPEAILLSTSPPFVTDFLDDAFVLEYRRPKLIKKLRVTIEETFVAQPEENH